MSYLVRIWFRWQGQPVFDDLGPFDRWLAEVVCVSMASGHVHGQTWVHVERAVIVPWGLGA